MAERKETPDILSEILSGPSTPEKVTQDAQVKTQTSKPAVSKKTTRAKKPSSAATQVKPQAWAYQIVSFQNYRGWRPRYINGVERSDWMNAPEMHEFLDEMSAAGWELVSATSGASLYGAADQRQMYFKRPISK